MQTLPTGDGSGSEESVFLRHLMHYWDNIVYRYQYGEKKAGGSNRGEGDRLVGQGFILRQDDYRKL